MKEKRLYVAYGSNLNIKQMKKRCPTAKLVGIGKIKDYELQFKGQTNSAFATIGKKERENVPVGVWEIQERDEKALDRYEGYPSHYFKENISVELNNGERVEGMVYIMNLQMEHNIPNEYYVATIMQGYIDCKLDMSVLQKALEKNTQEVYTKLTEYLIERESRKAFQVSKGKAVVHNRQGEVCHKEESVGNDEEIENGAMEEEFEPHGGLDDFS